LTLWPAWCVQCTLARSEEDHIFARCHVTNVVTVLAALRVWRLGGCRGMVVSGLLASPALSSNTTVAGILEKKEVGNQQR
jgi:hypothetical protein